MKLQKGVLLKNYSTFKIGGSAKFFCAITAREEVKEVVEWAKNNNEKIFVLGGGSNILFGSNGFNGLVIKIENSELKKKEDEIICGAGVRLSELVLFSIENNLSGLEWAVGIPGTVGGAIRGNAGAFGSNMADAIWQVNGLKINDGKIEEIELDNKECKFSYRSSLFKEDKKLLIREVFLKLEKGERNKGKKITGKFLHKRKRTQPMEPSAGSVFQNPVVSPEIIKEFENDRQMECRDNKVPAGWLIEQCDLRGKKIGGAQVSEKHANFIINTGEATAEDVIMLISIIKQKVRLNFGVQLREEIEIVV